MGRNIVWFSCGAASAVTAHLAIKEYGRENVHIVYCDTMKTEHPDNARFFNDVEQWLGVPIHKISSGKYTDVDDVFLKTRYMSGISGARCTVEMKKVPRFEFQRPDDVHHFGYTVEEWKRIKQFKGNNPELSLRWVLFENLVTKKECLDTIRKAGIELPMMYKLGYPNNNCLGCVKAVSSSYWASIREDFPEVFDLRCKQSRELGVKLLWWRGKRRFLDELPEGVKRRKIKEDISCGPHCGEVAE